MSINSVSNDLASTVNFINAQKPIPPTISGYSVAGQDDTALNPAGGQTVQINGTGFLPGATITFDGSAVAVVTYVSPNQLTFTSPAKSAGTYTIYVVNADGGTAIYIPGIIYSLLPTWTTSAGTLGSYYETTSISNTVVASGDAPITYSLFSGSLPTGSTLYANGVITGTAPVDSSSTTYSFTIQATDAQLQDSTRSFSLTINVDAVTWVSPANNTTYTSTVDSAIANVALSATDAAGYAISYSANALPTGLTLTGSNIAGTPTVIADSSTLLTATAATTNRTAVRTINWSITVANDVYFEYNTLLIPGASTTFVDDASTNNFAVTINGDTKPNNFNPYTPGYYSNYFDGNGDYLTAPNNAAFNLASNNFTIEAFFYTGSTSDQVIISAWSTTSFEIIYFAGTLYCQTNTSAPRLTTTTWPLNQWNHIAFVRSGNTYSAYLNGTRFATATDAQSVPNINAGPTIGVRQGGTSFPFNGYLSNLRVVNGTAVYDPTLTTLTVPTAPLTAIANTSLLTCQSNRFIDNSTNNFTLTVNGNTTVNSFDPFVPNTSYSTYGSGYFDGTGDYLSLTNTAALQPGSGDFTIECWINTSYANASTTASLLSEYHTGSSNAEWILGTRAGVIYIWIGNTSYIGTAIVNNNAWHHVAWVRNGSGSNNNSVYIDGVLNQQFTGTTNLTGNSVALNIGAGVYGGPYTGYISDVRIVKGTAVYTSAFTPPSAPLTAIANTSLLTLQNNQSVNNSVFLDNSTNNFFVTRNGNTTQGTFSPYGGNWSNYFDGNGDYLNTPSNAAFGFGTGDFTIEAWYYFTGTIATYQRPWWFGDDNDNIEINGSVLRVGGASQGTLITGGTTIIANTWYHIALTRASGSYRLWLNGTQQGSTASNSYNSSARTFTLMATSGGANPSTGYVSNCRIIKGTALYTSTFTPSTTPLTPITNTSLLTCADNRLVDDSINNFTITKNGDVSVQRFSPFNPSIVTPTSYSGYFDGTGDYLSLPNNAALAFGTGDFTVEAWIYPTDAGQFTIAVISNFQFFTYGNSLYFNDAVIPQVNGGTITTSAWQHVAISRSGTAVKGFINGSQVFSTTSSVNFTSSNNYIAFNAGSAYGQGYLSNFRILKGTALYTSTFTPPTSPLTAIANTSLLTLQSTTFIDNSTNNFTISAFGNSQPTQQNPFGFTSVNTEGYTVSTIGGSGYFDGTDYLTVPANSAFSFIGNFTIEFWVYLLTNSSTSASYFLMILSGPTYFAVNMQAGSFIQAYLNTSSAALNATDVLPRQNAWNHIALVRSGSTVKIYVNGTASATTATNSSTLGSSSADFYIANGSCPANYMSDFRINRGTAIYTSNFVPPSAPLTAVQNTTLLTNMTSAGIYDAAMMNNLETVGNAQLSTAVAKFGGSSMSFDGTGDYMIGSAFSNPVHSIGSGDFTIEMWLYTNANKAQILIDTGTVGGSTTGIQCALNASGYPNTVLNNSIVLTSSILVSTTTWTHVAWVRSSGTLVIYVNGVSGGSVANSINISDTGLTIGTPNDYRDGSSTYHYNGYIDDLRVTKGYARYTSNFTPPTTAFPIY